MVGTFLCARTSLHPRHVPSAQSILSPHHVLHPQVTSFRTARSFGSHPSGPATPTKASGHLMLYETVYAYPSHYGATTLCTSESYHKIFRTFLSCAPLSGDDTPRWYQPLAGCDTLITVTTAPIYRHASRFRIDSPGPYTVASSTSLRSDTTASINGPAQGAHHAPPIHVPLRLPTRPLGTVPLHPLRHGHLTPATHALRHPTFHALSSFYKHDTHILDTALSTNDTLSGSTATSLERHTLLPRPFSRKTIRSSHSRPSRETARSHCRECRRCGTHSNCRSRNPYRYVRCLQFP